MASWSEVGEWIKENAGSGAALVGSLLTGNVPGAVAAGVSLVSSATGTNVAGEALDALRMSPGAVVRLRELAAEEEKSIRRHIEAMTALELQDKQHQHQQTQETIRAGDQAEDWRVRLTRPGQSWLSLAAALAYVFNTPDPDTTILGLLLTLPWAYAGLRQVGKGIDSIKLGAKK